MEGLLGDSGVKIATAFCNRANGTNEVVCPNVFENIAMLSDLRGNYSHSTDSPIQGFPLNGCRECEIPVSKKISGQFGAELCNCLGI